MKSSRFGSSDKHMQPVYLFASERSGSNLLRTIVGNHPEISAPPPFETAFPSSFPTLKPARQRKLIRDILIWQKYSIRGLYEDIDPNDVQQRLDNLSFFGLQKALYETYAKKQGSSIWVSKYSNTGYFKQASEAFDFYDDLKIIYLVRDPRDVALSCKSALTNSYHPYFSVQEWKEEQELGKELLESRDNVHLVRYQDILEDPNAEIRSICDFLDIEAVDDMLAYHKQEEAQKRSSNTRFLKNVSKPIMSDNYNKFLDQLSAEEIDIAEKIAAEELQYFDFDLVNSEEELSEFSLEDESVYQTKDKSLKEDFERRMWREDPIERLTIRLGLRFALFVHTRYNYF